MENSSRSECMVRYGDMGILLCSSLYGFNFLTCVKIMQVFEMMRVHPANLGKHN